ncbi:hypothetical protein [Lacipirellula parvula]|uniref:Uncharacterized protein n=1 Tax=Lacipirellula parvula TaxID=2650471 RepID=A0A5K7X4E6_9BACT|nr:hypothetical protein [Lacipirellula parvula]BBO31554.1 hypothetical protein PLANPX_1166 [Lacipirellula parvula]
MKFSVIQSHSNGSKYYVVMGRKFPTRDEAIAHGEAQVAKAEALAGRELSANELRHNNGIAIEDRPSRERNEFRAISQQAYGYRTPTTEPKGEPQPHAIAWAEDALTRARFAGKMSDVAIAQKQLAAARAGAPPANPAHNYMLPGDSVTRLTDIHGRERIAILRPRDGENRVIHYFDADTAPAEVAALATKFGEPTK